MLEISLAALILSLLPAVESAINLYDKVSDRFFERASRPKDPPRKGLSTKKAGRSR